MLPARHHARHARRQLWRAGSLEPSGDGRREAFRLPAGRQATLFLLFKQCSGPASCGIGFHYFKILNNL